MALTVLLPENPYSRELLALLGPLLPPDSQIRDPDTGLEGLAGQRLLFALALDEGGCSESGYRMLMALRRSRTLLEGCVAGLVVTGRGELYTKEYPHTASLSQRRVYLTVLPQHSLFL